jgi:hypothetical protein
MKNASAAQRQAHLERARTAYQKVVGLWRQPECWQTNFAKNAGKFDFVSKKLADLRAKNFIRVTKKTLR